jgi:hypothetical protein
MCGRCGPPFDGPANSRAGMSGNALVATVEKSPLSRLQKRLACNEHDKHTCRNHQTAPNYFAAHAIGGFHLISPLNHD